MTGEKRFYFHPPNGFAMQKGINALSVYNLHVIMYGSYFPFVFLCRLARSVARHYLRAQCAGNKLQPASDYTLESDFLLIYFTASYCCRW